MDFLGEKLYFLGEGMDFLGEKLYFLGEGMDFLGEKLYFLGERELSFWDSNLSSSTVKVRFFNRASISTF